MTHSSFHIQRLLLLMPLLLAAGGWFAGERVARADRKMCADLLPPPRLGARAVHSDHGTRLTATEDNQRRSKVSERTKL